MSVLPEEFVKTIVNKLMANNPNLSKEEVLKSLIDDNIVARATFNVNAPTRVKYGCRELGKCIINVDEDADGNKIHKDIRRYIKDNIDADCRDGNYPSIDVKGLLCIDKFEISSGFNCGLADLYGHVFYTNIDY